MFYSRPRPHPSSRQTVKRTLAPEQRKFAGLPARPERSCRQAHNWKDTIMRRSSAAVAVKPEPPRPGDDQARDATVLGRLAALKTMRVTELKAQWRSLFG